MAVVTVRRMEGRKKVRRCMAVVMGWWCCNQCSRWSYCKALITVIENAENE